MVSLLLDGITFIANLHLSALHILKNKTKESVNRTRMRKEDVEDEREDLKLFALHEQDWSSISRQEEEKMQTKNKHQD